VSRIVQRLTRDIYGKIAALSIAIVLYLYLGAIATGVGRKELVVVRASAAAALRESNRIEIEEPPDTMVIVEPGKTVEATIEGPQNKIDQLQLLPLVGHVRAEFFKPWTPTPGQPPVPVSIPASAVEYSTPWSGNFVRLRETPIAVVLAPKERRFVSLEPTLTGIPAAGSRVRASYATPTRVEAEGPENELRSGRLRLAPVSVQDQSTSFTVHGHLSESAMQRNVRLLEDVLVVVQIEGAAGRVEHELPLSVLVPASPPPGERADAWAASRFEQKGGSETVHATFEGPPEALEQIQSSSVRAFVDLAGWSAGDSDEAAVPLQVIGLPEGCTFLPQRIAVRRIRDGREPPAREGARRDDSKGGGGR
jgi:hypothetical protein